MAANPPLVQAQAGLFPAPYSGEYIALGRDGVEINIHPVRTPSGKWSATGVLFLTNMRLVFVAPKPDKSGLQAFELPLAYISNEKFSQPIFGCNNLAGECEVVEDAGDPYAPRTVKFALYFKQGGVGTAIPLFMRFTEYVRVAQRNLAQQAERERQAFQQAGAGAAQEGGNDDVSTVAAGAPEQFLATALVDPNDPSRIYLTQPAEVLGQTRPDPPRFGATLRRRRGPGAGGEPTLV